MKYNIAALLITIGFIASSCNKGDPDLYRSTYDLYGKWNVATDSYYEGVGATNHLVNYTGQKEDYYDFKADNLLYIKEGSRTDTLHYTITSATTLIIDSFGEYQSESNITLHTDHLLRIASTLEVTPGGINSRKVDLYRH